jgi:hypothetical protein
MTRAARSLALAAVLGLAVPAAPLLRAAPARAAEEKPQAGPPQAAPKSQEAEKPAAKPAAGRKPSGAAAEHVLTWFALTIAHSELGLNVAYFWSKGPKLRSETVIAGHRIVNIVNGPTYYAFDAVTRQGVAIGRAKAALAKDGPTRRPFGRELEIIVGQGGEKVGDEQLGGRTCERYRVTDEVGRREIWVTKDDLRLPVRVESYTRLTGKTIATEYVNWAADLAIDDGFFEPEPGIELQRLSFDQFAERRFAPIGPVPVLYLDLLTGR